MRGRRLRTLLLTVLVAAGLPGLPAAASPQHRDQPSLVRFAHFAPEPAVGDLYVVRVNDRVRMNDVPYGAVSDYLRLPPGAYTFELRNARAPASAASEHKLRLRLAPGDVKTIFMYGPHPQVYSAVVDDRPGRPAAGAARVRTVNALSDPVPVNLRTSSGEVLARGLRPGAVSSYTEVPAGPRSLVLSDREGTPIARAGQVELRAGETLTLAANGGGGKPLSVVRLVEAAAASAPTRIDTGAGGAAHPRGQEGTTPAQPTSLVGMLALVSLVWLGTLHALARGRRPRPRTRTHKRS